MAALVFTIPGDPVAKQRPRHTRAGRTYTPQKTVNFEALVAMCAQAEGARPLEGALAVDIHVARTYPQSWSKKRRLEHYDTRKPDADNVAKSITDALNGIAYRDDAQIARLTVTKCMTSGPAQIVVTVKHLRAEGGA